MITLLLGIAYGTFPDARMPLMNPYSFEDLILVMANIFPLVIGLQLCMSAFANVKNLDEQT